MNESLKPPIGDNLLDPESREKLPALYSGEEIGLMAVALVKFSSPDSGWTWYASEFPSPLGMPPILTIVALSKRLSNHLLSK